jgi:hypothetical protein
MKVRNLFVSVDTFGQKIDVTLKGKAKTGTILGGIFTIVLFIAMSYYLSTLCISLL